MFVGTIHKFSHDPEGVESQETRNQQPETINPFSHLTSHISILIPPHSGKGLRGKPAKGWLVGGADLQQKPGGPQPQAGPCPKNKKGHPIGQPFCDLKHVA